MEKKNSSFVRPIIALKRSWVQDEAVLEDEILSSSPCCTRKVSFGSEGVLVSIPSFKNRQRYETKIGLGVWFIDVIHRVLCLQPQIEIWCGCPCTKATFILTLIGEEHETRCYHSMHCRIVVCANDVSLRSCHVRAAARGPG